MAPPVGPFEANLRARQSQYEQQTLASQQTGMETRNRVRVGAFEEEQRARREKEVAQVRVGNRQPYVRDSYIGIDDRPDSPTKGQRVRITDFFDRYEPDRLLGRAYGEETPQNLAFLSTPEGFVPSSRQTGKAASGPVVNPATGRIAYPTPPAGIVTSVAQGTATIAGLESLYTAYQDIRAKTAGEGGMMDVARQGVGTFVGETRMGGALAPEYAKYTAARRRALNSYIKAMTGAQFSVKELTRYDTQYPEPWDPEEVAVEKIKQLREQAMTDMQAKLRAFPGAGAAAPQPEAAGTADPLLEELWGGE
jgi:hypothetical protein